MLLLGLAGVSKLVDLSAFASVLNDWNAFPKWARTFAVGTVPVLETGLAGLWLIGTKRRMTALAAAILIVALSAAILYQFRFGAPPSCGCLGRIGQYLRELESFHAALWKNGLLVASLTVSAITTSGERTSNDRCSVQEA
jgi:hypothetical protein